MKKEGLKGCRPRKAPLLQEMLTNAHLSFANEHLNEDASGYHQRWDARSLIYNPLTENIHIASTWWSRIPKVRYGILSLVVEKKTKDEYDIKFINLAEEKSDYVDKLYTKWKFDNSTRENGYNTMMYTYKDQEKLYLKFVFLTLIAGVVFYPFLI